MKIYTKTGDQGETGLLGGERVSKASSRIEAIGNLDELNAAFGLARSFGSGSFEEAILRIQSTIFDLGAELAAPAGSKFENVSVRDFDVSQLETEIDSMTSLVPPLKNFVLPGGSRCASQLHVCRAICRRAERSIYDLRETAPIRSEVLQYINRLSDWLFVAARVCNHSQGIGDVPWRKAPAREEA